MLILASNSPRRKELLSLGGWAFKVAVSSVDEDTRAGEAPETYVARLAESKAYAALPFAREQDVILAADTTVVDGADILGKPADGAQAVEMLLRLRGRTHQVYTGIAALRVRDGRLVSEVVCTDVPMRAYSLEEMHAYVATGDPLDKAGAYAIQHPQFQPVESMYGCFASVMGLPLCHLTRVLTTLDLPPQADVPAACQAHLEYDCPIFRSILSGEKTGFSGNRRG